MIFNLSKYNSHWQTKALEDLGEFKRGKSKHRPRNDKALFENGTYPLVQTGEIRAASLYIREHSAAYNEVGLKQSKLWPEGTLCITIAANIAETALLGYPMCFPDSIVGFHAYPDESSELFMHYVFTYIRKSIQNSVSGSIQDNININYLTGLNFKIPKKPEQDRIVGLLAGIDSKIDLNNRINAELEAMAKTIYDYWFVQFDFPISAAYAASVGKPELEGRPYKSSGGEMVWNEKLKREVPKGWEVKPLKHWIRKDKSGDWGKESEEGNYVTKVSCVRGTDLNGINGTGTPNCPTRFILEKNEHKILEPFELIIEISGGSPTQSTGRMAFITEETLERFDAPLICSNFCKAVSLKRDKDLFFFTSLWNRLYDNGILFGWEGKTSGIKNLLFESFVSNYHSVVPEESLVNKFFEFAKPLNAKIQKNLKENQELASLRDWLLPMLMNGQVKVGEVKPSRSLSSADKDLEGFGREKEYVQDEEVGIAAEEKAKYHTKKDD